MDGILKSIYFWENDVSSNQYMMFNIVFSIMRSLSHEIHELHRIFSINLHITFSRFVSKFEYIQIWKSKTQTFLGLWKNLVCWCCKHKIMVSYWGSFRVFLFFRVFKFLLKITKIYQFFAGVRGLRQPNSIITTVYYYFLFPDRGRKMKILQKILHF